MSTTIPYLYQLMNMDYNTLASTDFKLAVVDKDDSRLSTSQINTLEASGKTVYSYLSIGEAENFRSYWQSSWNSTKPDWIIKQNPDWAGDYYVKFWDPAWQNIIVDQAKSIASAGYNGMYLDVVDIYTVSAVKNAYTGGGDIRDAMKSFVEKISSAVKAINPDFKVVTNNAIDLVTKDGNPTGAVDTTYLHAIDGLGVESTWYDGNNLVDWTDWNLQYLHVAQNAGKFVLSIDYPTTEAQQVNYINLAIAQGFIPFVGNLNLDQIDTTNYQIMDKLTADALAFLEGHGVVVNPPTDPTPTDPTPTDPTPTDPTPTDPNHPSMILDGDAGNNTLDGAAGNDEISGHRGADMIHGYAGNDDVNGNTESDDVNGNAGDDIVRGGQGDDATRGGQGNDWVHGNMGNDDVYGNAGDDTVRGGQGDDTLQGGDGNDLLYGDKGNDLLFGNAGADQFAFMPGSGMDTIRGFTVGEDRLAISSHVYGSAQEVVNHITYSDGDAVLDLGHGNSVTLVGVDGGITAASVDIF